MISPRKRSSDSSRLALGFAALLAMPLPAVAAPVYTELAYLGDNTNCVKCQGYLLPGGPVLRDDFVYAVHSDLPEMFRSEGVLYATFPILPPFDTYRDGPLPEAMRLQLNAGFETLNAPFEVFIYHMSEAGVTPPNRRIVVYTINRDEAPVTLHTKGVIEATGRMAAPDGPEIRLAERVFANRFDQLDSVTIPAGEGRVIAATPIIAAAEDGPDSSRSSFVNGIIRVIPDATSVNPNLDLVVVAIGPEVERADWDAAAGALLQQGAASAETAMDLRIPPPECHLRRVVGVYRNFRWKGGAAVDVTALPNQNLAFQMALPEAQSEGCEVAQQTQPMLLFPPYVRNETIGNYTIEYEVAFDLYNPGNKAATIDVRFGKQDASVGLVWSTTVGSGATAGNRDRVRSGWAGAWTKDDLPDNTRSFLDAPLVIPPGGSERVVLDFHIAGTSSLPFQIHIIRED